MVQINCFNPKPIFIFQPCPAKTSDPKLQPHPAYILPLISCWRFILIQIMSMSMATSRLYRKKETFQIVGKLAYHEQLREARIQQGSLHSEDRKVLVIHTGGTIGMFKNQNGKFEPREGEFKNFLQNYPYFSDQNETYFIGRDGFTITPESIFKRKIWYKFYEVQKVFDSTNMNIRKINAIMEVIEKHYQEFDAFIVTHGTDTMSYTASSLSFMIQNLKKTVIITGSQVPMGQTRNDGLNNLLCALTIAGHYHIPEVLVVFDNTIMRGNRSTKSSASSFRAFTSPNYYPIGKLGLKIKVNWELIHSCKYDKPTKFTPLDPKINIGLLKLTPFGISPQVNAKYVVVESYGIGNIPTEGPVYDWFKKNSQKNQEDRALIINISQVYQSVILNLYATGDMAHKLGLISGSDMTCEAAVAKLCYLASQNLPYEEIKRLMVNNLRGQLTEIEDRQAMKNQNYVVSCTRMLQKNFMNQPQRFKEILLYNVILRLITERSGIASLQNLCCDNELNFGYIFPDGGTLLHQYFKRKKTHSDSIPYLQFLLGRKSVDVNVKDKEDCTALFYAIQNNYINEASILADHEAIVGTSSRRVFRAIRDTELTLLQLMCDFGDPFFYLNKERRNVFSFAALLNNEDVFKLLRDNIRAIEDIPEFNEKDIYGKTARDYVELRGWEL